MHLQGSSTKCASEHQLGNMLTIDFVQKKSAKSIKKILPIMNTQ